MKGLVKFQYIKEFNINAGSRWERYIFDDTHQEYYMQSQFYDKDGVFPTYTDLIAQVPAATKLNYLVSIAALAHLRQLNGLMPDITDVVGQPCLPFDTFKFEILQSHIKDKTQHRVAIQFVSNPVIWIDTIGDKMLLAVENQALTDTVDELNTFLLTLLPNLTITHFKPIQNKNYDNTANGRFHLLS